MPLSEDDNARARQLANLKRGDQPAPDGNRFALTFGHRATVLYRDVSEELRELIEALGDTLPMRGPNGRVPDADLVVLEETARLLKQRRHLAATLDTFGRVDPKTGDVRPAVEHELRLSNALRDALASLGATPAARAKLGLDLVRGQAVADDYWRKVTGAGDE